MDEGQADCAGVVFTAKASPQSLSHHGASTVHSRLAFPLFHDGNPVQDNQLVQCLDLVERAGPLESPQ